MALLLLGGGFRAERRSSPTEDGANVYAYVYTDEAPVGIVLVCCAQRKLVDFDMTEMAPVLPASTICGTRYPSAVSLNDSSRNTVALNFREEACKPEENRSPKRAMPDWFCQSKRPQIIA